MLRKCIYLSLIFCIIGCSEQQDSMGGMTKEQLSDYKKIEEAKIKLPAVGEIIDDFNEVMVLYNGNVEHTDGRHYATDGYCYGLKWQCVEFVKRYYHQVFNHKLPNPWGHAIDFFQPGLYDSAYNRDRGLHQYKNGSVTRPRVHDILVFGRTDDNPFGHVAIISDVKDNAIEIVQQNCSLRSRLLISMTRENGEYRLRNSRILGWLGRR